jgi:ADP-ribose pyrophosphatase YjhB (NUDIX family)
MEFLSMTHDIFQAHINSTSFPPIDKVTVGADIIRMHTIPRILLLKRNADELYYPDVFEMPGGKVYANDASVREAITSEVYEETKLRVARILPPSLLSHTLRRRNL